METFWTVLKTIGAIVILSQPIIGLVILKRMQRKHADLVNMSSADLRALAAKHPAVHCLKVVEELKARGEDVRFALPMLYSLAIQKNTAAYLIGWGGLKLYFSDILPDLDLSKKKPTSKDINWMLSRLNKMESQQSGPAYPPQGVGSADP